MVLKISLPIMMKNGASPEDVIIGTIPFLSEDQLSSKYSNKSALIIGGTRGVGFGTALAMANAGADVTIVGRSKASGNRALKRLMKASSSSTTTPTSEKVHNPRIHFVQGDLGTVESANSLVGEIVKQNIKYDYLVVSAATFPDFQNPLLNDDGLDKSFGIAVVGRFIIYKNMHRFLVKKDARVLNVMASGMASVKPLDRELASGQRNVSYLIEGMMTFSVGNELMQIGLEEKDHILSEKKITMVSTHPGLLKTDLHRGQGILFDTLEFVVVSLAGTTEKECGIKQASILASDRLHKYGLSYVDQFSIGRVASSELIREKEDSLDWLWSLLKSKTEQ